jgi:exodeoxyribonuclease V alpha subunit
MNLDPTQLAAVDHAIATRFSVITGGAGTGKTTIIKELTDRLRDGKEPFLLCAFAGKAAARIKEATGRDASTIHRMLGYNGVGFATDSLHGKTVIMDEASMVDSELMAEIIKRQPARLILVGDDAQLPPVGKGQPFHDIIKLRPDVVFTLTRCYRNTEAVFKAATAIRSGGQVLDYDTSENEVWRILQTTGAEQVHAAILAKVREGFFDFQRDAILCPKNGDLETPATVESLNADIASILLPRQPHERFVAGDRVMNTKNLQEKDIWNGTMGTVISVNVDGGVHLRLDEPIIDWMRSTPTQVIHKDQVTLTKAEVKELKLAYAMTVHKAQGSQYRRVAFVCISRDQRALLDRPLIYTAVTRTRSECYVIGDRQAFNVGCATVRAKRTVLQQLAS